MLAALTLEANIVGPRVKSIGLVALYLVPPSAVYLLSAYANSGLHLAFSSAAEHIPSLANYADCAQKPEAVKSLHFFNIFYSVAIPLFLFKKTIVKQPSVSVRTVLLALILTCFGLLLMLHGFPLRTADGAGAGVAQLYCRSEVASFITLNIMSAGASIFYLMLLMFGHLYLKPSVNKALHRTSR